MSSMYNQCAWICVCETLYVTIVCAICVGGVQGEIVAIVLLGQMAALTHPTVPAGKMSVGIAQENLALQNITLTINPGEVFMAPQGLLHYNHNQQCEPNAFFQTFDSADPGVLNVIGALADFADDKGDGAAAMLASNAASVMASPQKAFALDQACLKRCHFPPTGAPNGGLTDLPPQFKALFGLK
jgi:hypothetical protein